MGKKNKHSKDKLHKTVSELTSHHVANQDLELSRLHRRLRFDSCCLSLNTITGKPMGLCDNDGYCYVFDCDLITKFLEKFQVHPVTGNKVSPSQLIELSFKKNDEDQYHCPIIYKLFNQHSKIVANKKTGHVYSYEAYQQLNLKPKNFKDLLTDEPFEKQDIVTIQDPEVAEEKWNVGNFYYVKNKLKIVDETSDSKIRNVEQSSILKSSLEEYKSKADTIAQDFNKLLGQTTDSTTKDGVKLDKFNSAIYSDGALAQSVTSTLAPIVSTQTAALLNNDQILYPRIKKKGYAQLVTNFGPLNLELFCDRTPKACHNFLLLATRGYYDNTIFHRLIKNFILQGGDPTGTGKGGESAWGEPFKDECHGDLKHSGRGVLAMANSGPGTNKSQFYITFRGVWDHLDGKHTVFGRVVGGDATLDRIEAVEVDKDDRPKEEVKIVKVVKYVDPFELAEAAIEEERRRAQDEAGAKREGPSSRRKAPRAPNEQQPLKRFRNGVGSYINLDALHKSSDLRDKQMRDESQVTGPPKSDDDDDDRDDDDDEDDLEGPENGHEKQGPNNAKMSLAGRLASIGESRAQIRAKPYGDFSRW